MKPDRQVTWNIFMCPLIGLRRSVSSITLLYLYVVYSEHSLSREKNENRTTIIYLAGIHAIQARVVSRS